MRGGAGNDTYFINSTGDKIDEQGNNDSSDKVRSTISVDLTKLGVLTFDGVDVVRMETHVFRATRFSGTVTESEEMRPQWYQADQLPYHAMWADNPLWFPLMLQGKTFTGHFDYAPDETIVRYELRETPSAQ